VSQSLDAGGGAFPFALDSSASAQQPALSEFQKLAHSDFALIYIKADGTFRFEGRHARLLDTTVTWTISDADLQSLDVPSTRGEVLNTLRVVTHPKRVDTDPTTTVYDQANVLAFGPGETKTLLGSFRDPDTGDTIGATQVQDISATTDYLANSREDGMGTDHTADMDVVVSVGPSGARFDITNNAADTVYLTQLQLRGKGVYDRSQVLHEARDSASVTTNGEHAVVFDMPYQGSDSVGAGCADYLLTKYADPFAVVRSITVTAKTTANLTQVLTRDISDRLSVDETVTGVASEVFINGVELTVLPTGHLEATYVLAPAADPQSGLYWILGTSVLGTDTVPSPF
jgi:hypothetical protein